MIESVRMHVYDWERKYIVKQVYKPEQMVNEYLDKYGAVILAVNDFGEEQHYYNSEQDYLDSIKGLE